MGTMESFEFKAETRQLLDLMIHSLYSHKDIFLRELISNASDALDRLRFEALTDPSLLEDGQELEVRLDPDPATRTLTVSDNGIGMSREELIQNIGTIAHSGTRELIEKLKQGKTSDMPPEFIGQFGVGFYSAFMVADKITLVTRRAGDATATTWESAGDGTYTVGETAKSTQGTSITLHLKPVDADNGIEDFTSEFVLGRIVRQYSDFVTYPVRIWVTREEREKDEKGLPKKDGETKTVVENQTLNSMKAIWARPKDEVTEEEYRDFYRHVSHDWHDPLEIVRQHAEGTLEYDALLFIPSKAPYDLFYQAYQGGLQLYVKKVKIMEHCEALLPRFLRFVRGIVDCPDVPLNVSREMLQNARELTQIRRALTKKLLDTLADMRRDDEEKYLGLWTEFGRALKEGVTEFETREKITDLLLFQSSHDAQKLTTLADYVERMGDQQKVIYYITGESREILENLPHLETLRAKGLEVLYLTEPVDELMVQHLTEFGGKRLKSVAKGEIDLDDEEKGETAQERESQEKQHADLLTFMQTTLDAHVKQVRLSNRLTTSAACLVGADHDYSPQLEKLLMKGEGGGPKTRRILEVNPDHPVFELLQKRFDADRKDPSLVACTELLFGQALLSEGLSLPDPVKFSRQVADIMVRGLSPSGERQDAE